MATGMLPPCDMAACTCRREVWRQMYISRNFWFDHLFSKIKEKNILKNSLCVLGGHGLTDFGP
jgi:hypothetical protein